MAALLLLWPFRLLFVVSLFLPCLGLGCALSRASNHQGSGGFVLGSVGGSQIVPALGCLHPYFPPCGQVFLNHWSGFEAVEGNNTFTRSVPHEIRVEV